MAYTMCEFYGWHTRRARRDPRLSAVPLALSSLLCGTAARHEHSRATYIQLCTLSSDLPSHGHRWLSPPFDTAFASRAWLSALAPQRPPRLRAKEVVVASATGVLKVATSASNGWRDAASSATTEGRRGRRCASGVGRAKNATSGRGAPAVATAAAAGLGVALPRVRPPHAGGRPTELT